MKKSIIASLLGVAGLLAMSPSSNAQGTVYFANYDFGQGLNSPVTFATAGLDGATSVQAGWGVGSGFTVQFLYSINGGATWLSDATTASGGTAYPGSPNTGGTFGYGSSGDGPVDGGTGAGYFVLGNVAMPSFSGSSLELEIQAFSGSSYGQAGYWSGQTIFTAPAASFASGITPPSGDFGSSMPAFSVAFTPVSSPEPSSLALAGLGGFGMLMAFRRKKA